MRKLHDSLSDPKYDAAKTSRKFILDAPGDSDSSEDAESDSHVSEVQLEIPTADHETGANRKVDTTDASTERPSAHMQNGDLSSKLHQTREEDRKKGKAISKQLASQFLLVLSLDLHLASRLFGTRFLMPAFAYRNPLLLEIAFPLQVAVHFPAEKVSHRRTAVAHECQ